MIKQRFGRGALAGVAGLALGCSVVSAAHAEDWKVAGNFGWLGVGKAHQLEKGHVFWVGEFSGTFFNDKGQGSLFNLDGVKCPAAYDFDFNHKKGKAQGYCVVSDPGGDKAFLSWQCQGDTHDCHGTFDYTGGTGRFQGISGSNKFNGVVQVNWADGTTSGYATWNC